VVLLGISDAVAAAGAILPLQPLPFGDQDPHAVTEKFLAQHPDAALSIRHLTILSLEPAGTPEGDTGSEEGMDRVPYVFDRPLRIRLELDASADQVGRLVLKDGTGREVACLERKDASGRGPVGRCAGHPASRSRGVLVRPGPYALEVHHARKGQVDAPVQRVFVRSRLPSRFEASSSSGAGGEAAPPNAGAAVGLEASATCRFCDYSNSNLDSEDFSGATLSGSTFTGASLKQTNFNGAVMQGCLLMGQSGSVSMPFTVVNQTTFIGADLTGAYFDGVTGQQANFTGATLDATSWAPQTLVRGCPDTADSCVYPAVMVASTFSGAKVKDAIFNGALLDYSTFASATITAGFQAFGDTLSLPPEPYTNVAGGFLQTSCQNCQFDGATILGSIFDGVSLRSATFVDAVITDTTFTDTTFNVDAINRPADLTQAVLTGALLDGVDLFGTTLTGVDLTVIAAGSVIHSDFSGDLTGTNFGDFNFAGFDLSNADVSGAILSTQSLESLRGATLSDGIAHGIGLAGVVFPKGFGEFQGKDLRYANLTEATLEHADLSAANLANAILIDTHLAQGNLQHATLTEAVLQGAVLDFANLDGANLQDAHLNKSPTSLVAAHLNGAFLRNANLASANLSGASLANANFYSSICVGDGGCECPPGSWSPVSPTCASATGATMTATVFTGAYLSGVDMSGSTLQAAEFDDGAVLVGVNFTGATLSEDPNGNPTLFNGAFLQGTNLTNATVTGADFTSAYVDLTSTAGATLAVLLDETHTQFTGYWATPATPACVQVTYTAGTTLPSTDSSNICPDVTSGPCSNAAWESPQTPITNAQPPSSFCQPGSCQCTLPGGNSVEPDLRWIID